MKLAIPGSSTLAEEAPIFRHTFNRDEASVKDILSADSSQATVLDAEKRSPLHAAAYCNLAVAAEDIVEAAADPERLVNGKDNRWLTPLHRACRVNAHEVVSVLLSHGADPNAKDKNWQTPGHVAAANGAVESLRLLLDTPSSAYPFKVHVGDRSGRTCLQLAAYGNNVDCVRLLLDRGAPVDQGDKHDRTALHWAAFWRHPILVAVLLKAGASPNVQDKDGCAPVHAVAVKHDCPKDSDTGAVLRLLTIHGADLNASDNHGDTAVHSACLNFNPDALQHMLTLAKGSDDDEDDEDDILEAVNRRKETAIHVAAGTPDDDDLDDLTNPVEMCLEILLAEDRSLVDERDQDRRTALHLAAVHGCCMRVKLLLSNGANVELADAAGLTPLHLAAENGHVMVVDMLLGAGADPWATDTDERTPAHLGAFNVCKKLCAAVKNPVGYVNLADAKGMTCLHLSAYDGNVTTLEFLLIAGAEPRASDMYGRVPLHYAAAKSRYACVVSLVKAGSDVNARDANGCTPLHFALQSDLEGEMIQFLLANAYDSRVLDGRGYTPLHYASSAGNSRAVMLLKGAVACEDGVQIRATTAPSGCLHLAASNGHVGVLRMLLSENAEDVNTRHEKDGMTALEVAAKRGHAEVVLLLLERGADGASEGLHLAASEGHFETVMVILHLSPKVFDSRGGGRTTPLMTAASLGHTKICVALLNQGAAVNARDAKGRTSLYAAAVNGHDEVCQLLLDKGADVKIPDKVGKTPVHAASIAGQVGVLCTLLDHLEEASIDPNALMDADGFSPGHWAAYLGQEGCLALLANKGTQDAEDGSFSPGFCAVAKDNLECLRILMSSSKCTLAAKDRLGRTLLHVSALTGGFECGKVLIENGVDVDAADRLGRTPIMMAAMKGDTKMAELLLSKSCRVDCVDSKGNTALHYGCVKSAYGEATASDLILKVDRSKSINVSHQNKDGRTPLHLAASRGLVTTTETLLMRGASITSTDKNGLSPALACAPNDNVVQCLAMILAVLLTQPPKDSTSMQELISSRGSSRFSESSMPDCGDVITNNDATFTVLSAILEKSSVIKDA